jgi:hypothetical protein
LQFGRRKARQQGGLFQDGGEIGALRIHVEILAAGDFGHCAGSRRRCLIEQ